MRVSNSIVKWTKSATQLVGPLWQGVCFPLQRQRLVQAPVMRWWNETIWLQHDTIQMVRFWLLSILRERKVFLSFCQALAYCIILVIYHRGSKKQLSGTACPMKVSNSHRPKVAGCLFVHSIGLRLPAISEYFAHIEAKHLSMEEAQGEEQQQAKHWQTSFFSLHLATNTCFQGILHHFTSFCLQLYKSTAFWMAPCSPSEGRNLHWHPLRWWRWLSLVCTDSNGMGWHANNLLNLLPPKPKQSAK